MSLSEDIAYSLSFSNLIIYAKFFFLFSQLLFKNLSGKDTAFC